MNQIKFSHSRYLKHRVDASDRIRDGAVAHLVSGYVCDVSELPESFIEYDTAYLENGEIKHYPLPKGLVIVLFFWVNEYKFIFPTIRRWTPKKAEYYESQIGKEFKVVITE